MVFDRIENLGKYLPADKMAKLAPVIAQLTPDCEERTYEVDGDNMFIKAMSYTAIDPKDCKIEAHDKYIDIQVTITGSEGISVFERDALSVSVPYDEAKDMLKLALNGIICVSLFLPAFVSCAVILNGDCYIFNHNLYSFTCLV